MSFVIVNFVLSAFRDTVWPCAFDNGAPCQFSNCPRVEICNCCSGPWQETGVTSRVCFCHCNASAAMLCWMRHQYIWWTWGDLRKPDIWRCHQEISDGGQHAAIWNGHWTGSPEILVRGPAISLRLHSDSEIGTIAETNAAALRYPPNNLKHPDMCTLFLRKGIFLLELSVIGSPNSVDANVESSARGGNNQVLVWCCFPKAPRGLLRIMTGVSIYSRAKPGMWR